MAEYTANELQNVAVNNNVLFSNTVKCNCNITHRDGSGLFTLHGGRKYLVAFSTNLSGATADEEVTLAVTINGEVVKNTTMAYTPPADNAYGTVSRVFSICVPCGCCYTIGIRNIGVDAVNVVNADLIFIKEE